MPAHVTVDQWVEMFKTIGLDSNQMHRWHEEFERRHPDAHQSFMEWLKVPAPEIAEIRRSSASGRWS